MPSPGLKPVQMNRSDPYSCAPSSGKCDPGSLLVEKLMDVPGRFCENRKELL